MRLGQRLMLTFVAITVILIAPAVYGLFALRALRQVADNLSTRDAVGALALGRLQTAFSELDNAQRIYLALAANPEQRNAPAEQVMDAMASVEAELEQLRSLREGGYQQAIRPALEVWTHLQRVLDEEQRLVQAGDVDAADAHREAVVDP